MAPLPRPRARAGLHLDASTRAKLTAVKKELASLQIAFEKNLTEEDTKFVLSKSQLAGLSDAQLKGFPPAEKSTSQCVVLHCIASHRIAPHRVGELCELPHFSERFSPFCVDNSRLSFALHARLQARAARSSSR